MATTFPPTARWCQIDGHHLRLDHDKMMFNRLTLTFVHSKMMFNRLTLTFVHSKMMSNRWLLKNPKYTSSGTGCQIRLQASQNKTKPCMLLCAWPANKDCGPVCCSKALPPHNNTHLQTNTAAPCVVPRPPPTTTPTCKQTLRPRVLFQGPPHNNPHLQTKTAAPCVVPRPPCHDNLHLQTKTVAPCVVPRPPPTTTSKLLLNGSYKQRLEPRVLFLPCTASEIITTTPTLTPPPAAALLLLPL